MKKVLITGAGSYIGTAFEKWIADHSTDIVTETLDMKGEAWREHDFHGYDSVFHVAGLAHADVGKVTEETKQLYYKVNCGAVHFYEQHHSVWGQRRNRETESDHTGHAVSSG